MEISINVKGMHCPSCDMLIEDVLMDLGADVIESSYKKGVVKVGFDNEKLSLDKIKAAIRDEGYEV